MTLAITMKTIAAQAGVTQATVSMSLANNPRIPVVTRERIQAIARKLNYEPNPYISTLMRVRRQGKPLPGNPVLALVNAQSTVTGWREHTAPTIRQMREGALARATARGYRTEELWLHRDGMSNARFSQMLHARGIQGLLLSPLAEGEPVPALHWPHFATVCLSVPLPSLPLTTVCNDHYFSSGQAVRECHRRGYRRPGLILHREHQLRFQGRWEAGFLLGRTLFAGIKLADVLYVDDWLDAPRILGWLKKQKPDVIITPSAEPLVSTLTAAGCRIPADLGLALLACPRLGDACSGVFQNGRMIGSLAIDVLTSLVERNERGLPEQGNTVMLEGNWNEGTTLRAVRSEPNVGL